MSTIEEIHATMSLGWQREPVRYPACDAVDLRYLEVLASSALEKKALKVMTTEVQAGNGNSIQGTILEKGNPYGEKSALVLKSPHRGLEGMIIAKVPGTQTFYTKRPLFAYAAYPNDRVDIQKDIIKVRDDLKDLNIAYPDANHLMIDSIMTLLTMTHMTPGDSFYQNILLFSNWLRTERSEIVQANWT